MKEDILTPDVEQFFRTYRLKRAPRASTCVRIMMYVLRGNRTKGITPDRRADIVRQLQIEWVGQSVRYVDSCTGRVLYIAPATSNSGGEPRFEAMVRWDEDGSGGKKRANMVGLNTLTHIA